MIFVQPVELPPQNFPLPREERTIDFNPDSTLEGFEFESDHVSGLLGTTNVSGFTLESASTIGARWYVRTSSSAIDNSINDAAALKRAQELGVAGQLAETKRLTGYSWEQLAKLLGCSRQTLHLWMEGKAISDNNRERLARLHATILYLDRGSAEENRAVMDLAFDGSTIADLLQRSCFDDVKLLVRRGIGRPDRNWGHVEEHTPVTEDHWFDQIVRSEGVEDTGGVRAEPQTFKRLQLRKG